MKDVKKSVERLVWRLKKDKQGSYTSFKPNENDFKELLNIIGWIDRQKEISLLNGNLFAKLYIYHLSQMIETYSYNKTLDPKSHESYTSFLESEPQKELSKILDRDIETFYLAFHNKINSDWRDHLCRKLIAKKDITQEYVNERYSFEKVKDQLNHIITEAINKFS